ncbi:histidine phosphatase family protein [Nesterenkonia aerolata]|uniref:Histidine phosphatase family protein n=1 Tax=Nesterenkonia aerolata TaxID=3074079 RepID=A0ABU2DS96_9MICC|nr:histidine phosphatase family protein [Nesterenkonia sp. LY-0111]MDR8019382.1 histidine phosphatase family protein [Nesterenkonia sp. LY-0111]
MIRVLLCRHGETDWNRDHRLQGHSDIPLAESGRRQAAATGAFVRAQQPQLGHVSSLVRTQQTYEQFGLDGAGAAGSPQIWDELREQNLGVWEGAYAAEIRDSKPEEFAQWRSGDFTPEGGESQQMLAARMGRAFCEIVRQTATVEPTASPDLSFEVRTAVAVSHGAALRVLFESMGLIDRSRFIPLTPASVTVIDVPLTDAPLSSSLPRGGVEGDDLAGAVAALSDEQIVSHARLRVLNLSPELLLNP